MKRLTFTLLVLFIITQIGFAQMQYRPIDLKINTPENTEVYKRYMEGKTYVGFNLGLSVPFGDYGTDLGIGLGAGLQAKYFITDHIVFGANFNYYNSSFSKTYIAKMDTMFQVIAMADTTGLTVLSVGGNSSFYPFTLNFEYYFTPKARFKPFLGLGLGYYVINHNIEVLTNKEKPQAFREEEAKVGSKIISGFGLTPYAGFMVDFNELISMNFDVRFNQVFSTPSISTLSVNLGLIFNLSYKY